MMHLRLVCMLMYLALVGHLFAEDKAVPRKKGALVLEALTIEGKIKKPQVALISVDKRPSFKPLALASLESKRDFAKTVDKTVFEYQFYDVPFPVNEDKIGR